MTGTYLPGSSECGAHELLRRVVDVYHRALEALEIDDNDALTELLAQRGALLEEVKARSARGWPGEDIASLEPLSELLKSAEKQFIERLDARVQNMRQQMIDLDRHKRGVAVYRKQATPHALGT